MSAVTVPASGGVTVSGLTIRYGPADGPSAVDGLDLVARAG